MVDLWRDFWIRETGTGQQVAQLHERYMMMMVMIIIKARGTRRITAAEVKYMRTAGYTWTDYKTNAQIAKELKITPILDKLLEYKRSWIQHVNRMPRNRLPSVMKHYCPTGRRNHGRPLKRLLDTWDRNGSTSGPTAWQIYDDDDENYSRSVQYDKSPYISQQLHYN